MISVFQDSLCVCYSRQGEVSLLTVRELLWWSPYF